MSASLNVLARMMTGMGGDAFLLFYAAETATYGGVRTELAAPRAWSLLKNSAAGG